MWETDVLSGKQKKGKESVNALLLKISICVLFQFSLLYPETPLRISGATTVQKVAEKIAEIYSKKTGIPVDVQGGGSGAGIKNAIAGESDVGMVSRSLTETEKAQLNYLTCAYDALVLIVNSDNPLNAIDRETVVRIYSGKVLRWNDVCGWDEEIVLISKEVGRATLDLFEEYSKLNHPRKPAGGEGNISEKFYEIGANIEAITLVGGMPGAIGYVSLGTANEMLARGMPIRILELDGVKPEISNVLSGKYPIGRELNFVFIKRNEKNQVFLETVLSDEAQKAVSTEGFIPVLRGPK